MATRTSRDGWLPRLLRHADTAALRPWLAHPDSLTARIRARCTRFEVRVLAQRLARPHRDEARLLHLRAGELAWLREVLLLADEVPVVYARSVLPRRSLRGAWRLFAGIGDRPLGAALFSDPRIRRAPLRIRRLDPRDRRQRTAARAGGVAPATRLWARRSVFTLRGRALMVCEVFLPGVLGL